MLRLSVVALVGAVALSSAAEARAGRGFSGFRKASPAPQARAAAPAQAAKPASGGSVNVFVPVPIRRGEARVGEAGGSRAAPRALAAPVLPAATTATAVPALAEPAAAPRPWCEGGSVVGGLCLLN
jgi:hypothetical protein